MPNIALAISPTTCSSSLEAWISPSPPGQSPGSVSVFAFPNPLSPTFAQAPDFNRSCSNPLERDKKSLRGRSICQIKPKEPEFEFLNLLDWAVSLEFHVKINEFLSHLENSPPKDIKNIFRDFFYKSFDDLREIMKAHYQRQRVLAISRLLALNHAEGDTCGVDFFHTIVLFRDFLKQSEHLKLLHLFEQLSDLGLSLDALYLMTSLKPRFEKFYPALASEIIMAGLRRSGDFFVMPSGWVDFNEFPGHAMFVAYIKQENGSYIEHVLNTQKIDDPLFRFSPDKKELQRVNRACYRSSKQLKTRLKSLAFCLNRSLIHNGFYLSLLEDIDSSEEAARVDLDFQFMLNRLHRFAYGKIYDKKQRESSLDARLHPRLEMNFSRDRSDCSLLAIRALIEFHFSLFQGQAVKAVCSTQILQDFLSFVENLDTTSTRTTAS